MDPFCLFHGKRRSEHLCLYCCLCFENLTEEQCNRTEDGKLENVCVPCAQNESKILDKMKKAKLRKTE